MNYGKNPYGLYGTYPIGELFITLILPEDRNVDPNRETDFYWDEDCIRKMLQPVGCNSDHFPITLDTRKSLCEMAWYYDPEATDGDEFPEAATADEKTRGTVAHGFRIFLNPERLRRLAEML